MNEVKHIIISRMIFSDKELLKKYLVLTKEMLVPNLKAQTNKNFTWGLLILEEDVDFVRKYLGADFMPFHNNNEFISYVKVNNINIQTRHDIDDYMLESYVERIQTEYAKRIDTLEKFLIQFQPVRVNYQTKEEYKMSKYTETGNSMFLSLCQKNVTRHIFERQHGQMYEVTNNVVTIPEGYVKWIIHGNNITCKRTNMYND